MMSRISELREEHFQQQTRIAGLTETLANQEREFKASRETIMKLVGDVSQERRAAAASAEELAALRRERDEALAVKTAVQREVRLLQERLEESRRGWAETRQQLQGAATRAERAEDNLQGALRENGATRTLHGSLLCQLAALLGNGVLKVPETEEGVLERVRELCSIAQGRRQKEQEYERELRRANEQLEQQGELHQQSLARARHAETLLSQHKDTLRHTEESLAARHLLQETLSHEKKQHQHFVEVMAQTLAVEEEVLGRPPQLQYDTLLTRVQGLATEAQQSGPDLRELLVALQKKVVSQKAKLERRQAEIETLQQEQLRAAEESRRSRETSLSRATLLQAQDQHRAVEELNGSLLEARRQREAAEERAAAVRAELEVARREARQGREESQRVLALQETLCEQLRVGQRALREVARRERAPGLISALCFCSAQLVDFRVSVLRVLGLDASGASVPDSLLLARLEKCVSEQRPVKTDGSPKRSPGPNPPATATVTHVISGKAAHTVRGP
ncbi:CC170 protein, partial [Amia calva]|nr:CC170 protein [Amia calva]